MSNHRDTCWSLKFVFVAGLFFFTLLLAVAQHNAQAAEAHFVLISHGADGDPWWNIVKNAVRQADEDFDVQTDYLNPATGDLNQMAKMIRQATQGNYDGVITTIPNFDLLQAPIMQASINKVPLVTINVGTDEQAIRLGALMHISQNDYRAGEQAGRRAKAAGVTSFVCVTHFVNTSSPADRCRGFADALGVDYREAMLYAGTNPEDIKREVSRYLRAHPKVGALLALGPLSAEPALAAVRDLGLTGKIFFCTFDFSRVIGAGIRAGAVQFAIDQQPYLQGYIAVAALAIARKEKTSVPLRIRQILNDNPKYQKRLDDYGLQPSYSLGRISSGPGFITRANIDIVEKYADKYR